MNRKTVLTIATATVALAALGGAALPAQDMRHAVVSDWMFFPDNEDWLRSWSHRFGDSAVQALADELRRTNWRQLGG